MLASSPLLRITIVLTIANGSSNETPATTDFTRAPTTNSTTSAESRATTSTTTATAAAGTVNATAILSICSEQRQTPEARRIFAAIFLLVYVYHNEDDDVELPVGKITSG